MPAPEARGEPSALLVANSSASRDGARQPGGRQGPARGVHSCCIISLLRWDLADPAISKCRQGNDVSASSFLNGEFRTWELVTSELNLVPLSIIAPGV